MDGVTFSSPEDIVVGHVLYVYIPPFLLGGYISSSPGYSDSLTKAFVFVTPIPYTFKNRENLNLIFFVDDRTHFKMGPRARPQLGN